MIVIEALLEQLAATVVLVETEKRDSMMMMIQPQETELALEWPQRVWSQKVQGCHRRWT